MSNLAVALVYKNFAANRQVSHIGLGVAAINTAKVLRRAGIAAKVWPIVNAQDLALRLSRHHEDHVVISAPWIPTAELATIAQQYPDTEFAVNCHSNVGFLQADRNGVHVIRELMELELATHNVHLAGNSQRFCSWIEATYGAPCLYLPNLYFIDHDRHIPQHHGGIGSSGPLRIGVFGAVRPLKNIMTGAAAALELGFGMRVPLEVWVSGGRSEGGGETVLGSVREMFCGLPHARLVINQWEPWPKFRKTVRHMHLLLQPSYTETFNMVTADGVVEGVASVVSEAIDWAPRHWKAEVDDALDIARVGRQLLHDPQAAQDGMKALVRHVAEGLRAYQKYFRVSS